MRIVEPITISDIGGFTRASTATYWDKNGVLQTAAIDTPRWTYDPLTGEFDGLLLEKTAVTNLVTYSEQLDNAAWAKSNITTVVTSVAIAPDATMSMDKIVPNAINTTHYIEQQITGLADNTFVCVSAFFKKAEYSYVTLNCVNKTGTGSALRFNFDTKTITLASAGGGGADIRFGFIELINGVFLLYMENISVGVGATTPRLRLIPCGNTDTSAFSGDGVSGVYCWGAMFHQGSSLSSYIKTIAAPGGREADIWTGMMLTNIPENDYAEWNSATAYVVSDRAMVTTAAYHYIYQAITNNTNKDPTLEIDPINSPVDWQLVGKTNRWKPFDGYQSSQSTIATEMIYSVLVPDNNIVDSIVLYNVNAYQARIIVTDDIEGVVYQTTVALVSESGITDYWEYFFAPVVRMQTLVLTGLPAYSGQRIDLQLMDEGGSPALGAFIIGLSQDIGKTQYGMQISSTDYSVKKIDDFGNITLTQRPYSDELMLNAIVKNTDLAAIKNLFTRLRATPIVVIGAEDVYDEASAAFCIIESWSESVNYPDETLLAFKGKGLT